MIADHATSRAVDVIDEVWSHIPTDLPTEQAMRVAQVAIEILSAPTDAEVLRLNTLSVHLGLAAGLAFTIAYALLGLPPLAWAGAACHAGAFVLYVLHLVTE